MFEGFTLEMVELPEATLRVRHGGSGSPVLLLHGHLPSRYYVSEGLSGGAISSTKLPMPSVNPTSSILVQGRIDHLRGKSLGAQSAFLSR